MAEVTFEVAFESLQQSVKRLESGQLTLEQSLLEYENGIKWSRICQEHLEKAEQKLQTLSSSLTSTAPQSEVQN
jgi:exodeoxyribonuclease VII small subunit